MIAEAHHHVAIVFFLVGQRRLAVYGPFVVPAIGDDEDSIRIAGGDSVDCGREMADPQGIASSVCDQLYVSPLQLRSDGRTKCGITVTQAKAVQQMLLAVYVAVVIVPGNGPNPKILSYGINSLALGLDGIHNPVEIRRAVWAVRWKPKMRILDFVRMAEQKGRLGWN